MAVRKVAAAIGGVGAIFAGVTGGILYVQTDPCAVISQKDRDAAWHELAGDYDSKIDESERSTGITKRRKDLMRHVGGRVVEVAAGTGRNLRFLPDNVEEIVLTDRSLTMCQVGCSSKKRGHHSNPNLWLCFRS